jgi:micrococcal nuclease
MNLPKSLSRNKIVGLVFTAIFGLGALYASSADWKVKYVVDGDTIVVEKNGKEETVRLLGIDAPEVPHEKYGKNKGDCFGKEASDFLASELSGGRVALLQDPSSGNKDKYGRSLRYALANGRMLNAEMVRNGYAFVYQYSDFFLAKWFYKLEKQAKSEKLGLWGKACQYFSK